VIRMVICNANRMDEIPQCIDNGLSLGTMFLPPEHIMRGRKRWILSMPIRGHIVLDKGAVRAVLRHKSLFPAGVVEIQGDFQRLDAVQLLDSDRRVVGNGLINYSSSDAERVMGMQTDKIDVRARGFFAGMRLVTHTRPHRSSQGREGRCFPFVSEGAAHGCFGRRRRIRCRWGGTAVRR
jgi:glutamate 5-kinase